MENQKLDWQLKKDGFRDIGSEDEKLMEVALQLQECPQIYDLDWFVNVFFWASNFKIISIPLIVKVTSRDVLQWTAPQIHDYGCLRGIQNEEFCLQKVFPKLDLQ